MIRRPASPGGFDAAPRGPPGAPGFPRFAVLSGRCDSLAAPPAALRLPSLGGTVGCVRCFAPAGTDARPTGPGRLRFGRPVLPIVCPTETAGLPSSWGTPLAPSPCSFDPGRTVRVRPFDAAVAAPAHGNVEGSRDRTFEAQSHGFGARCLRFAPAVARPRTQDSLPAAGQALPGGLLTRRVPMRGFSSASYITSSSSQAFMAQSASIGG